MSESILSFQTWICPICCDDHAANTLNQAFCKTSDLQNMANEIEQLKSKLKVAVEAITEYSDLNHAPKLEEALKEIES